MPQTSSNDSCKRPFPWLEWTTASDFQSMSQPFRALDVETDHTLRRIIFHAVDTRSNPPKVNSPSLSVRLEHIIVVFPNCLSQACLCLLPVGLLGKPPICKVVSIHHSWSSVLGRPTNRSISLKPLVRTVDAPSIHRNKVLFLDGLAVPSFP